MKQDLYNWPIYDPVPDAERFLQLAGKTAHAGRVGDRHEVLLEIAAIGGPRVPREGRGDGIVARPVHGVHGAQPERATVDKGGADKGHMLRESNGREQRTPVMFAAGLLLAMISFALCAEPASATVAEFSRQGQVPPLPPKPPSGEATMAASALDTSPVPGQDSEPRSGGKFDADAFTPASTGATETCAAFLSLPDDAEPAIGAPCGCIPDEDGREGNLMVWQSISPLVCVVTAAMDR